VSIGINQQQQQQQPQTLVSLCAPLTHPLVVLPNVNVTKCFRIRNESSGNWESGTRISFKKGDKFEGLPESICLSEPLNPSKEMDVVFRFKSPAQCGKYIAVYRLYDSNGCEFGFPLKMKVFVDNNPGAITQENLKFPKKFCRRFLHHRENNWKHWQEESMAIDDAQYAQLLQQVQQMGTNCSAEQQDRMVRWLYKKQNKCQKFANKWNH